MYDFKVWFGVEVDGGKLIFILGKFIIGED